ncbi:hypothetical protein PHMEG_00035475 [Phytophthora megakarya]|uniref:DDE-1 domain-containing protein n=1 Tax=Phytophthora megakarya TaxID=4795 RepID=A0A225UQA5_9STRA|nr:hypothetical protein PHMEG_00035475 [Phytophthora megakarya]
MEKPRRQNHYAVEQRREMLEQVAVEGCKPTARALNDSKRGAKSKITFECDLVTFTKNVPREYLCTGVMIAYMKMEQGAYLELYISDISSPETRSCDYTNEIDAPSVLLLDNSDSHVSEDGQNIVANETSAIVYPVPANSTSVSEPLEVGVMGTLKKKLSAEMLREKMPGLNAKQKRVGVVMRTIRAWEDISAESVVKSFEKAIPKEPEVML